MYYPHYYICNLQLSPTNENKKYAERFTGCWRWKDNLKKKTNVIIINMDIMLLNRKRTGDFMVVLLWKLMRLAGNNKDNKDGDILPWYSGVKFIWHNDKANIQIGCHIPITSTDHSTVQALLLLMAL